MWELAIAREKLSGSMSLHAGAKGTNPSSRMSVRSQIIVVARIDDELIEATRMRIEHQP